MNRIETALIIVAGGLTPACQGDQADQIAALTKRVDALEKTAAAAPPKGRRAQPQRPDPAQTYYLPVRADDPYRGSAEAKVTIVEVYEFACPYCAMVEPLLADTLKAYEGTNTLKVVSKQFVVHPQLATDAALGTCAANRQGKFASFAEGLWQKSWNMDSGRPRLQRDQLSKSEIVALAKSVGLDIARFEKDMASAQCKTKLTRDKAELARIGVRGTPYLFINGRYYTGGRTVDALKSAVDAAAKKADTALSNGITVAQYYDELMKNAKRSL